MRVDRRLAAKPTEAQIAGTEQKVRAHGASKRAEVQGREKALAALLEGEGDANCYYKSKTVEGDGDGE